LSIILIKPKILWI